MSIRALSKSAQASSRSNEIVSVLSHFFGCDFFACCFGCPHTLSCKQLSTWVSSLKKLGPQFAGSRPSLLRVTRNGGRGQGCHMPVVVISLLFPCGAERCGWCFFSGEGHQIDCRNQFQIRNSSIRFASRSLCPCWFFHPWSIWSAIFLLAAQGIIDQKVSDTVAWWAGSIVRFWRILKGARSGISLRFRRKIGFFSSAAVSKQFEMYWQKLVFLFATII